MNYYLLVNDEAKGPLTLKALRELLDSGVAAPDSLVAVEESENWMPLAEVVARPPHSKSRKSSGKNMAIGAAALLVGGILLTVYLRGGDDSKIISSTKSEPSPSEASSKQKANAGALELYMQGYRDPAQGDTAEVMIDRAYGEERDAYRLIILGAEDRRAGLPVRFELAR